MNPAITRRTFFAAIGLSLLASCSRKDGAERLGLFTVLEELAEQEYTSILAEQIIKQSEIPFHANNTESVFSQHFKASASEENPIELKKRIQQEIAQDFASGNALNVNGWHLSQKEAVLYALAYTHSKSKSF